MDFFLNLVTPLSDATGIPVVAAALISLFALGLLGHFIIRRSVQRLGVFADTTSHTLGRCCLLLDLPAGRMGDVGLYRLWVLELV